ncbi:hypothetical protein OPV22_014184 [Ensete ventricosum]|uniref:Uncharacterized protein n=1 Tax=Ensete ventricosum TaxID=4639 RepID=A0AAV8R972_ENSVE|nr:hypothetical protein OPV22_014184 [Ensete ventricosum]
MAPRAPGSGARRRKARETWMDRVATTGAMASTSQNYHHIRAEPFFIGKIAAKAWTMLRLRRIVEPPRARDLSLISACYRMYETWSDAL